MSDGNDPWAGLTSDEGGGEVGPTLIGAELYNQDGTFAGQLVQRPSGKLYLATKTGSTTNMKAFSGGSYLTAFNEGVTLGANGELLTSRDIPFPTTPDVPSAPAYSSTRQAQVEAQSFQAEQARLDREAQVARDTAAAEQDRLDRENTARMNRLSDLNDLIQQAMGNQQSAREMKFGLRTDPFALAGTFSGGAMRGTTPTQAFGNQLQNFAQAPLPQLGADAQMPQIEQGIQQVQAMGAPPMGGGFGMEQGGTMGPMGPDFSPPGYSVIVGEGALNGDEEVVTRLNDGTVLVTPLKGGAQYGGTFGPTEPTSESSYAALSPLYRSLGLSNIPTFQRTPTGYSTSGGLDALSRLGYQPSLVRTPEGGVLYRNPSGQYQPVTSDAFAQSQFRWGDVFNLTDPADIARVHSPGVLGAPLTAPPSDIGPGQGAFGPAGTPFTSPFGQLLPNPYNVAGPIRWADPILASSYASAYGSAKNPWGQPMGIDPETLMAMAESPFPTGVQRGVQRRVLGFR